MIPAGFKPTLAVEADLTKVVFPVYVSAKLDGIRCVCFDGVAYSRSLKPIRNKYIQSKFSEYSKHLNGFDGELIVGDPTASNVFQQSSSGVMSEHGEPDFQFHIFDKVRSNTYELDYLQIPMPYLPFVNVVTQLPCGNMESLMHIENQYVNEGYEGVMLRNPKAPYKFGRSTVNEGFLLKVKRFADAEFKVVGFEERNHNANAATTNALGHTERSSHKGNLVGRGDLGSLLVQYANTTLSVGSGFNDDQRTEIWNNQPKYLGQFAKVKYQSSGMKDLPRFPIFVGWRDQKDM